MVSELKFIRVKNVKQPQRGTPESAGIDFFVPDDFETLGLLPGESCFIPSGIKVNVPAGHALVAFNKSGVAVNKNLHVGACVCCWQRWKSGSLETAVFGSCERYL